MNIDLKCWNEEAKCGSKIFLFFNVKIEDKCQFNECEIIKIKKVSKNLILLIIQKFKIQKPEKWKIKIHYLKT